MMSLRSACLVVLFGIITTPTIQAVRSKNPMASILRANPHLEEIIQILDQHLVKYNGDFDLARDRLSKAENDWIDAEVLHCLTDARYFISNYYAYRDEKEGFKGLYPLFD